VGLAGTRSAMYHLTTHAFFKALLFLGAGSVIHGMHHQQDIWCMGGLKRKMPVTFWTFLIATLALSGIPPFSGFFSKDAILATALQGNPVLFGIGVFVAVLTTFYMFRLVFVAFYGTAKSEDATHAHDSPAVMTVPLIILFVPTVLAGFFGIATFMEARVPGAHHAAEGFFANLIEPFNHAPVAAFAGIAAVIFGLALAFGLYWNASSDPLPDKMRFVSRTFRNRFYFDEIYALLINLTHENLARLANGFDRWIVGGLFVRGLHGTTELTGRALRLVQTGNLQTYAFVFVFGLAALLFFLFRG
jgi:NADH-quinone oxidoreductase subunit L